MFYGFIFKIVNKVFNIVSSYVNEPKRVTAEILKYKISSNKNMFSSMEKFINFSYLFDSIKSNKVQGEVVEIGTGIGVTLSQIILLRNLKSPQKKIYSFDTFENTHSNKPMKKASQFYDLTIPNLINAGVKNPESEVDFIIGDVKNTLLEFNEKIALLHLDVDLPEVYEFILPRLWENLSNFGYIIFDEYDNIVEIERFGNMKLVIDDFLKDKNHKVIKDKNLTKFCIQKI